MADKDNHLGVVELDASLAGTKSTPCCSVEDKDDHLGLVEPDSSLAGTESGPHTVPWQIRMIVWEWLNWMPPWLEQRMDLMLFRGR